ncbi:MAG: RidA family protein [Gudongella sp.]|nr:RidA family protein [Gudongella sp.]
MIKVQPKFKGENKGHYSPGVISNGMLYVSGQLSIDPDTRELPVGGVREHARQALSNVERVLKEAGAAKENVVQCRIYIIGVKNWDAVNEVYSEFFGDHKPARIVVPVPELHGGSLVEIEAVAEMEDYNG